MKKIYLLILITFISLSHQVSANKWEDKMSKQMKKNFDNYVLRGESKGNMVLNIRNVPEREGLISFFNSVTDRMGVEEKGIEFNISYTDKGDQNDWERWGIPGHAQRFQIMEPIKKVTKKNKTKWYRVGYFLEKDVFSKDHNFSLFDFKMIHNKTELTVGPTFNFAYNDFVWAFNSDQYKEFKNETGFLSYYPDQYIVVLEPNNLKGKWVNVLINAKWSKDGFLHMWIDGKLRSSYYGNLMPGKLNKVRFKFGPYRNHMDEATAKGVTISDATIRYSNVGKANSCEELWSGCDELTNQLKNTSQINGAKSVIKCETFANKPAICNNLGYPKNKNPF